MTQRRYGGFWRRFFAYLIDKIVLYLVSLFLLAVGIIALGHGGGVSFGRIMATGDLPRGMGLFAAIYTVALFITDMIYFTWFHGSVGQTPGKMLLGLRVIQASGDRMNFGIAFLRWVGSLVSSFFLWIGYLWIAVDGRKQGWHDKIAATVVIRASSESDDRSSPDATAYPPPVSPSIAQGSADAWSAGPPPPPITPLSNADMHEETPAASSSARQNAISQVIGGPVDQGIFPTGVNER